MSEAPSLPWRAILWVERFLPAPPRVPTAAERATSARRWAWVTPLIVTVAVVVPQAVRHGGGMGDMLAAQRWMLLDLLFVSMGAVIVAALSAGLLWRRGTR